ncbi:MAG: hypothetical protein KDC46_13885, partial [Thermoleophilia bacterium]|nr:hypothetical protein [Thermoleophilia bacterium]
DPNAARERGLAVAPEVALLHAAAAARGVTLDEQPATSAGATEALARLLEGATGPRSATRESSSQPSVPRRDPVRAALRPLVDARVRVLATGIVMVAALMAASLAAAAIMAAACAAVVVAARIDRARVRLAVRPLVALTVMLVLLQLLVGGAPDTQLWHGRDAGFAAAPALLRSLQAAAIVLATLALGAATTALDLASALRRLLAPLAIVRVPVASLAFVVATALGLVPAMADELERLRLARRARGIEPRGRHPLARLRADAALVAPLFVAAFRRAHLLADALAVRGVDPREPGRPWRPMHVPSSDVLLLVAGVALLAVSRFA